MNQVSLADKFCISFVFYFYQWKSSKKNMVVDSKIEEGGMGVIPKWSIYIYIYNAMDKRRVKNITELLYVICISNTIHLYLLHSI